MKRLFIQLNVVILLMSVFSFHCQGADKYTLEYTLEKGKTYKQRMVSEVNMKINAMGQDMKMEMGSETCVLYEVVGLKDDVYDVRALYQKIKTEMGAPMPFSIDSDFPEQSSEKNIGEMLKSLTEIPFDIQLTKQGKVISVKGVDKLAEKINTISNEQFKLMFSQLFSEKTIQSHFEQMSAYFPDKPVAINDSWDVALNLNSGGMELISKMTLTLKQVKDNVATLEFTGTLATPEGGAVLSFQGMDAQVAVNGEQTGTVQLDMKTGWNLRSELIQRMTQKMELMGQEMLQEMETKTIVTAD